MQILREEVLVKVTGGADGCQRLINNCIDGVEYGLIKDFGPLSAVRGLAQFTDGCIEFGEPGAENRCFSATCKCLNAVGKIAGGLVQTYVLVKLARFAYNKLSKNERIKQFFVL